MAKPTIKPIDAFDASQEKYVEFAWAGKAAYNNRLTVYYADTMNVAYDHVYSENYYKLNHKIPSGTLLNGIKYTAQITVIDSTGTYSEPSDKFYFWVLESPAFFFEGLSSTSLNTIDTPSYVATLNYTQNNDVKLASYQFFLYNSTKELLDSSDVIQNTSGLLSYTYRTLENNTVYYIRATGFNARNVPVDTGYVQLMASYINPNLYTKFYTDVNRVIGTVDYYTNIISIESDLDTSEYSFDEGCVDLTGEPSSIRYSRNFVIPESCTISVRMKEAYKTAHILSIQTGLNERALLESIIDDDGVLRYKLSVHGTSEYIIYSGGYVFDNYDMVTVHIRRENCIYELYVFVTEIEPDPPHNMWFMLNEPPIKDSQYNDIWLNIDYPTQYIDQNSVVRFYQPTRPLGASNQNIWIGN